MVGLVGARGLYWCVFVKVALIEYFNRKFWGQANGCELKSSVGVPGNFKWTPAK